MPFRGSTNSTQNNVENGQTTKTVREGTNSTQNHVENEQDSSNSGVN